MKVVRLSSGDLVEACERCIEEDGKAGTKRFWVLSGEEAKGEKCTIKGCGSFRDVRPSEPHYRPHLFNLNDAVSEVSGAQGAADTAIATGKLVGKTLANVGVFAGKFGFIVAKEVVAAAPERLRQMERDRETEIRTLERDGRHEEAAALQEKLDAARARRSGQEANTNQ